MLMGNNSKGSGSRRFLDHKLIFVICSFILSMLVLTVIIFFAGYSPTECYKALFHGAFGGLYNIANTLGTSTPLILAGLGMMFAGKSGTFNIGLEGQIIAGAFVSSLTGIYCAGLPKFIHVPLTIISAMAAGGLWGSLIAVLKRRLNVSEIIIAIMLNYIIDFLTRYLLTYHLSVPGLFVRTDFLPESATLTKFMPFSRLNTGILFALIMVFIVWYVIDKTTFGFEIRATGYNPHAAESAGISMKYIPLFTMFISGAIAGMAGAIEVMGVHNYFTLDITSGYGFTGVAIGIMGGGSALGTLVSGIVFGALRAGSTNMNRVTAIPGEFIIIFQALVIVFVSTPNIARAIFRIKRKRFTYQGKPEGR